MAYCDNFFITLTHLKPFQPALGEGIYDREGVVLGQSYTRTYRFIRTSGPAGSVTYNLTWVGNDGTFSSAGTIALPRNQPVLLPVSVNPQTIGSHSAILNLDAPSTVGIDYLLRRYDLQSALSLIDFVIHFTYNNGIRNAKRWAVFQDTIMVEAQSFPGAWFPAMVERAQVRKS